MPIGKHYRAFPSNEQASRTRSWRTRLSRLRCSRDLAQGVPGGGSGVTARCVVPDIGTEADRFR
ncbi:hypothetical protein HYPDE_23218 [Hyphomicrobium denitrificans 1NES1]|uniref:Uncharacterized protein n=1 Tax=Hyphomicrobium denitrificans 1NES1 TaxID=670307 RepID=N0B8E1_9HYPH|nr:hypothetical protein HYPDE_23218 [Hyphomicrobium denitrificans 1NES1]